MIPKSTSELKHDLAELTEQDIRVGQELNHVENEIMHAERELSDAKRRKAARQ